MAETIPPSCTIGYDGHENVVFLRPINAAANLSKPACAESGAVCT
jgi:hypothetical protein